MLVSFNDAEAAARGVHARLQRIRNIKSPSAIFDAARLPVLRSHNVDQWPSCPSLNFKILLEPSGEVALPRRDGAPSAIQDLSLIHI